MISLTFDWCDEYSLTFMGFLSFDLRSARSAMASCLVGAVTGIADFAQNNFVKNG